MRKIFKYFTVMLLMVTAVGCDKEDDVIDESSKKELFITADKVKVAIGEQVEFNAIDKTNNTVSEVSFYVNGVKIPKQYNFNKRGVFNVVAKKVGYKPSAPVSVFVSDGGEVIGNKLKLTVDKNSVYLGEAVKFTVTVDGKEVTDYKIQHVQGETLESSTWVAGAPGVFKFIVTKTGYATSDVVEVNVLLKSTVTDQTFTMNGKKYDILSVELTIDVDMDTKKPILYKEGNMTYYVYKLFADNIDGTYAMYIMRVVVPADTNKIIMPYEVPANKLTVLGAVGYIDNKSVVEVTAMDIKKAYTKWGSPLVNNRGGVEYEFGSEDYDLEVKFKGEYKGLGAVNVNQGGGMSIKVERRNTGFSFDNLKKDIKNR